MYTSTFGVVVVVIILRLAPPYERVNKLYMTYTTEDSNKIHV